MDSPNQSFAVLARGATTHLVVFGGFFLVPVVGAEACTTGVITAHSESMRPAILSADRSLERITPTRISSLAVAAIVALRVAVVGGGVEFSRELRHLIGDGFLFFLEALFERQHRLLQAQHDLLVRGRRRRQIGDGIGRFFHDQLVSWIDHCVCAMESSLLRCFLLHSQ